MTSNKAQLIDLICDNLITHTDGDSQHKLTVIGSDSVPVEVHRDLDLVIRRQDMATTQEQGDTLVVQCVAQIDSGNVLVVADDTDILVLLMHFCFSGDITCHVMMVSPAQGRSTIDINASVEKHHGILQDLLAAHGLTGCDTVATYFGIGKGIALKVLRSGKHSISYLGNTDVQLLDVTTQAQEFILACYNQSGSTSMTEARQKVWSNKVGGKKAGAPKLCSLPPTNEACMQNILRAHLQVAIWRHSLEPNPPDLDPTLYGWSREENSMSLSPNTVSEGTPLAPTDLLKLIRCSCSAEFACSQKKCGCNGSGLACTVFCSCGGSQACFNENTKHAEAHNQDNEDD